MAHDYRYAHVKSIWKAGDLTSFSQIFTIIPKYIISNDLGINYGKFNKKTKELHSLTLNELSDIADLTGVPYKDLVDLVLNEFREKEPALNPSDQL